MNHGADGVPGCKNILPIFLQFRYAVTILRATGMMLLEPILVKTALLKMMNVT